MTHETGPFSRTPRGGHINTLKLRQLRSGEWVGEDADSARLHLGSCALCQARAGHQDAVRAQFEARPTPAFIAELNPDLPAWPRFASFGRWAGVLLPMAALALLWMRMDALPLSPTAQPTGPAPADHVEAKDSSATPTAAPVPSLAVEGSDVAPSNPPSLSVSEPQPATSPSSDRAPRTRETGARTKGLALPKLEAWVLAGDSARPLYKGESLGGGTRLQLRYDPQGRNFVTLAGRDSNGLVEVYATIAAGSRGLQSAPFGLTLDDAAGEQTFFAVCSDTRPDPEEVTAALAKNPVRMEGAVVSSLVVRKD